MHKMYSTVCVCVRVVDKSIEFGFAWSFLEQYEKQQGTTKKKNQIMWWCKENGLHIRKKIIFFLGVCVCMCIMCFYVKVIDRGNIYTIIFEIGT